MYNRREPPPRPAICGVDYSGDGLCPAVVAPQDQPPQRMPAPASSPPRWQSAFGSIIQSGSDCLECADRQLVSDIQVGSISAARFPLSIAHKTMTEQSLGLPPCHDQSVLFNKQLLALA